MESLEVHLGVTGSTGRLIDVLFIMVEAEADWKAVSPALPDPLTIPVTLTATDPDGLSASVTGDFFTNWESHPDLVSATAGAESVELTFDQDVSSEPRARARSVHGQRDRRGRLNRHDRGERPSRSAAGW